MNDERELEQGTRKFAAELSSRATALRRVTTLQRSLLEKNDYVPRAIEKWLTAAAEVTADCPRLEEARLKLLELSKNVASVLLLQLESGLRELCSARGWRIDGQWPEFVVNFGSPVRVDEKASVATVGPLRCEATVIAIGKALESQIPTLLAKSFSAQKFLDALFRAYQAASGSKGGQISILEVYRWMVIQSQPSQFWRDARSSLFAPMSIDQFRARLSTTLECRITRTSDVELRLLPPLDVKDAVFLFQPSESRFGYVGRLEFVRID